MRKFLSIILLSMISSLVMSAEPEVTFSIHTFEPSVSNVNKTLMYPLAKDIEDRSKGKIKVNIYPSMSLGGKPTQLYDQVKDGVVDIGFLILSYTPNRFPKTEVFELPMMLSDPVTASKAIDEYIRKNAMDEFTDVKVLGFGTHGPSMIFTRKPISSLNDLRGMKIRGSGRQVANYAKELGATPISMPITETLIALTSGVIDGVIVPWEGLSTFRLFESAPYGYQLNGDSSLGNAVFAIVMNKNSYDKLSPDLKVVVDESTKNLSARLGEAMKLGDVASSKKAYEGNKNTKVDKAVDSDRSKSIQASERVRQEWVIKRSNVISNPTELLNDAQNIIAKHSK